MVIMCEILSTTISPYLGGLAPAAKAAKQKKMGLKHDLRILSNQNGCVDERAVGLTSISW